MKRKALYFTKLQAVEGRGPKAMPIEELAAKISNDISEGADCRESRSRMRDVIAWYAGENCRLHMRRSSDHAEILLLKLAISALTEGFIQRDAISKRRANRIIKYADRILDITSPKPEQKDSAPTD